MPEGPSSLPVYLERYADFLRRTAGVAGAQTAHLSMILLHFGLKVQRGRLGPAQRGFIVPGFGAIMVNDRDKKFYNDEKMR